jgi:gamma-glutamylcyclotransferase (GGCT)/AIG2-like uncharacterized protein YtfP
VLNFIFVYGTLRSEFDNPHARFLRAGADLVARATVPGSVYAVGAFPGFRPSATGHVVGELYQLRTPRPTLEALDLYEGDEFERKTIEVCLNGESYHAWIYMYRELPAAAVRIESGDFCAQ